MKYTKYDRNGIGFATVGKLYILPNISKGTAFLLQGLTENDYKGKNVTI